ncbi:MAG: ATP-binding cassette domain-containing protein [Gemmatimonadetes bacterium]|nr:ATP-binding cassette domain-containing protein [Gemmatimonadota bacterium]
MTTNNLVIETELLTKRFGNIVAVDGLSLEIPRGHVFGLLGPNGSGKTTTMGMLLGLVRPSAGRFSLFGGSITHREALTQTGAVVEFPSFYPHLSGRDNLAYFQEVSGKSDAVELDKLLDKVGLAERGKDRFQTYSLGMKQRLGLAYVLLGNPELLILDEPTNGMDPDGMAEVRELIRSLGDGERTVLLSSHLLHEVEQVCDSVAILSHGRLVVQGRVDDLVHSLAGEKILLRTTDNAKAIELISKLDWVTDVTSKEKSILVSAPPKRSTEISEVLSRSAVYIAEMTSGQMSLEEYYFKITSGVNGDLT